MKKLFVGLAVGVAVALAAPADAKFKRIKKEAEFIQTIAGTKMVSDEGTVGSISPDGTFKGKLKDGRTYYGNWKWSRGYWSRAGVLDGEAFGTDCQKVEVDGNVYRLTRQKGKGTTTSGTFK